MVHSGIECSSGRPSSTVKESKGSANIVYFRFEKHVPANSDHEKVKVCTGFPFSPLGLDLLF